MSTVTVIGAGLTGATAARVLADAGIRVEVWEKKSHIGGAAYDWRDDDGTLIQQYGPHIFHTNSDSVTAFLGRFTEWIPYRHKVMAAICGKLTPLPFNFSSIDMHFRAASAEELKCALRKAAKAESQLPLTALLHSADDTLRRLGVFVKDAVFTGYTRKQWGVSVEELDDAVLNRVPVCASYDSGYFSDRHQYMPSMGYTDLIQRMLRHELITVTLDADANGRLLMRDGALHRDGTADSRNIHVYTGCVARLARYALGALPYRTLRFDLRECEWPRQPVAVVNYPNDFEYTRVTEFSHFYPRRPATGRSAVMFEFPLQHSPGGGLDPYYPVPSEENRELYSRYVRLVAACPNLRLAGRLGRYRYMNMDAAVLDGMNVAKEIIAEAHRHC